MGQASDPIGRADDEAVRVDPEEDRGGGHRPHRVEGGRGHGVGLGQRGRRLRRHHDGRGHQGGDQAGPVHPRQLPLEQQQFP